MARVNDGCGEGDEVIVDDGEGGRKNRRMWNAGDQWFFEKEFS